MSYQVALIRHGETALNIIKAFVGCTDDKLTPKGRQQAHSIGKYLASHGYQFDQILHSPLARAAETAEIIRVYVTSPIQADSLLRERDYGIFEGLTKPQFLENYPGLKPLMDDYEQNKPFVAIPNGETAYDVESRIKKLLFEEVPKRFPKGGSLLFVAHLNPIRAVLRLLGLADWPIYFHAFKNTSLTVIKTNLLQSELLINDFSCED
jgi:broad specificity phosphatase PhoE